MKSSAVRVVRPSKRFKLAILLLAPVLSLAVLEVGFRCQAHVRNLGTLRVGLSATEMQPDPERTRFLDIIRPHSNSRIIYDLRPDLDVVYKGRPLTTNSHGFRSPECELEADPNTITIVAIGASIQFGHGVADEELYTVLLEGALNREYPERRWRLINTAVPSYNVVMKVETLKARGLAFKPDLVLLNVASNNLDLPRYLRVAEKPLALDRSFLLKFFSDVLARKQETRRQYAVLGPVAKGQFTWRSTVATAPQNIPPEYRALVGWEPFHVALDELADLSAEHEFEVVTFATLDVDLVTPMLAAARARDFHVITLMDELVRHMRGNHSRREVSVEGYKASELVVSPNNLHPSVLQHRMAAERLLAEMDALGLIERLLERRAAEQ